MAQVCTIMVGMVKISKWHHNTGQAQFFEWFKSAQPRMEGQRCQMASEYWTEKAHLLDGHH